MSSSHHPAIGHGGNRELRTAIEIDRRPATILFGRALPQDALAEAVEPSRACDVFLAIGSSLVVEPAASLPRLAKQSGARLAIINHDQMSQDAVADAVLNTSIGETLPAIDRRVGGEDSRECN